MVVHLSFCCRPIRATVASCASTRASFGCRLILDASQGSESCRPTLASHSAYHSYLQREEGRGFDTCARVDAHARFLAGIDRRIHSQIHRYRLDGGLWSSWYVSLAERTLDLGVGGVGDGDVWTAVANATARRSLAWTSGLSGRGSSGKGGRFEMRGRREILCSLGGTDPGAGRVSALVGWLFSGVASL